MIKETMTCAERVRAALSFEEVDRTPFTVVMSGPFVATAAGMSIADAYHRPPDLILKAEMDLWDALGGWDGRYSNVGLLHITYGYPYSSTFWAIPRVMPGHELPDNVDIQNVEAEIMKEDDYDRLLDIGWEEFFLELMRRTYGPMTKDELDNSSKALLAQYRRNALAFAEKGVPALVTGAKVMDPVTMLATWRSVTPFMMDIQLQYDKVKKAVQDVIMPFFLEEYKRQISAALGNSKAPLVMVPAARYIVPFVSPEVFDDLQWTWMKGCADIVLAEGRSPLFHLDSNWDENLECFLRLPKGTCAIHFGGETDILKAKEVLKGRVCVMGDASPAMMSLASSREVEQYYRDRVDALGADSGYIMSGGCYLPGTAKVDNVKAMIAVARNYKPH